MMYGQGNDSPQHQALMQLARAETVQEAEQLLSEMCLNQPTRISTLDAMIQQIQQNGIHPSSACCSAIITAFVDAGLLDRAKAYLQYIKAQHKDLPLRTYNVLIDAFGKAQDFQTMEELYEWLLSEGITPNVITYNTMLFAFGKAGRFAKMDSFFNQMLQDQASKGNGEQCITDVTTFITLMDAHGRAGHIEQMEIYHRAMLAAGHKPSLKVYNALLSAYGKAQDIEQMTYYVNKMEANGIPPNTGSYNILIGVFGKMGKIDVMEQFYTALRQSGLTPDVFTFNSMLAAYGKVQNESKIQETWQEMLAAGVQPNVATYQNAIEAYSRLGHISMMEAMYHEAMRKGMQLGVWAYSSLLAAYCNVEDTQKVESTFESMAVHKVHPNVRCFSSVIKAHAKAGDVETMERRFRQLMASPGNRPDLEIFITVIKGYGPRHADRAINAFLSMKPSRVMPTAAACHAVLEVCSDLDDAKELRRLWAQIPQFCKDTQCCKLYSDIMTRLGEADVLGAISPDDLALGHAPPDFGGGRGRGRGNSKRGSRGARHHPAAHSDADGGIPSRFQQGQRGAPAQPGTPAQPQLAPKSSAFRSVALQHPGPQHSVPPLSVGPPLNLGHGRTSRQQQHQHDLAEQEALAHLMLAPPDELLQLGASFPPPPPASFQVPDPAHATMHAQLLPPGPDPWPSTPPLPSPGPEQQPPLSAPYSQPYRLDGGDGRSPPNANRRHRQRGHQGHSDAPEPQSQGLPFGHLQLGVQADPPWAQPPAEPEPWTLSAQTQQRQPHHRKGPKAQPQSLAPAPFLPQGLAQGLALQPGSASFAADGAQPQQLQPQWWDPTPSILTSYQPYAAAVSTTAALPPHAKVPPHFAVHSDFGLPLGPPAMGQPFLAAALPANARGVKDLVAHPPTLAPAGPYFPTDGVPAPQYAGLGPGALPAGGQSASSSGYAGAEASVTYGPYSSPFMSHQPAPIPR